MNSVRGLWLTRINVWLLAFEDADVREVAEYAAALLNQRLANPSPTETAALKRLRAEVEAAPPAAQA